MGIDISRLGPLAQAQILAQLNEQKQNGEKKNATKAIDLGDFDSELERKYYLAFLFPLQQSGQIKAIELHKKFLLYEKENYCGINLPKAQYTADFFVEHKCGMVEVVEVKAKAIRKLQRDYIYRRRLFIEKYAKPNGWVFREYME